MFSSTTMASSTTMPMASTIPSSVSTLIEKPATYITKKAPMSETGIASTGMSVERQSRRKRKMMSTTRIMAMKIVSWTSRIELRMYSVVSKPMLSSTSAGRSRSIRATRRWNSSMMAT